MQQAHRNRVFHDFRNGLCRNLVCSGNYVFLSLMFLGYKVMSYVGFPFTDLMDENQHLIRTNNLVFEDEL